MCDLNAKADLTELRHIFACPTPSNRNEKSRQLISSSTNDLKRQQDQRLRDHHEIPYTPSSPRCGVRPRSDRWAGHGAEVLISLCMHDADPERG